MRIKSPNRKYYKSNDEGKSWEFDDEKTYSDQNLAEHGEDIEISDNDKKAVTIETGIEMVREIALDELYRTVRMISQKAESIKEGKDDSFNSLGILAHQLIRCAYRLDALQSAEYIKNQSEKPESHLEKQIRENKEKHGIKI